MTIKVDLLFAIQLKTLHVFYNASVVYQVSLKIKSLVGKKGGWNYSASFTHIYTFHRTGSWLLLHFVSADQKLQLWRYQHKWDMFSILYADNSKPAETHTLYVYKSLRKVMKKF